MKVVVTFPVDVLPATEDVVVRGADGVPVTPFVTALLVDGISETRPAIVTGLTVVITTLDVVTPA